MPDQIGDMPGNGHRPESALAGDCRHVQTLLQQPQGSEPGILSRFGSPPASPTLFLGSALSTRALPVGALRGLAPGLEIEVVATLGPIKSNDRKNLFPVAFDQFGTHALDTSELGTRPGQQIRNAEQRLLAHHHIGRHARLGGLFASP